MAKKFYVTTAIPYVNAEPHIGHALEIVQSDTLARYRRKLLGNEVYFLWGADENALKNVRTAEERGVPVADLVDQNTRRFKELKAAFNLSFDSFIRTADRRRHWPGAQKLWQECKKAGDIYKGTYRGLYCLGCEAYYAKEELVDGLCPEHRKEPELVEEENYFFKLSKYQTQLEKLILSSRLKIVPETRKKEILNFIKKGLEDFSVSRSKERAKGWGVPVPDDPSQIQYVWFDALANYLTALGYGGDGRLFKKWWPADLHIIGKGILRFHAVYWPAILLSAGIRLPKEIFVHGYVTVEGRKISKSLGNTVDPFELVKEYGTDAVRYYLLRAISPFEDGNFSAKRFEEIYNADLANGLGNLVARVAKLCETSGFAFEGKRRPVLDIYLSEHLDTYRFDDALVRIWQLIRHADRTIDRVKPWGQKGETLKSSLQALIFAIRDIAFNLWPFLPETAEKIEKQFRGPRIKSEKPLFPRI